MGRERATNVDRANVRAEAEQMSDDGVDRSAPLPSNRTASRKAQSLHSRTELGQSLRVSNRIREIVKESHVSANVDTLQIREMLTDFQNIGKGQREELALLFLVKLL